MNAQTERLTGQELLLKMKGFGPHARKRDKARAAGYVSVQPDGTERIMLSAFYQALLEAKGIPLETSEPAGRPLSYVATVHTTTGQIVIGDRYVVEAGLTDGDQVGIRIKGKNIILERLQPVTPF